MPQVAHGYALNGYTWPDGSQIVMHLGLNHSPNSFRDGTGSWNESATDALNTWNQYIDLVHFAAASAVSPSAFDGANSAFFSSTIYGQTWGRGVLAVTLRTGYQGNTFTETDVIFNDLLKWSSYRGPLIGSGPSGTYDFHRVALHEFGHVLGLDHPDQYGQSVEAIMNSVSSDLDHLADDDIASAKLLYAFRINSSLSPSVFVGTDFAYLISANNKPTNFSATGLPAGLHLNPNTGLISGMPTQIGAFDVIVTAYGPSGNISATIHLVVLPPKITSNLSAGSYIGSPFYYPIAATNQATGFSVTNLPAGLSVNATTGEIIGVPTLSGSYSIEIRAHTNYGDAVAILELNVIPLATPQLPAAQFGISSAAGARLASDDARRVIYAISGNKLAVIDPNVLAITRLVTLQHNSVTDLSISPDGTKLWLGYDPIYDDVRPNGQFPFNSLDLATWTLSPDVLVDFPIDRLRAGLNNRLYITYSTSKLLQVDATNGAIQKDLWDNPDGAILEMSPDHRTLFAAQERGNPSLLSSFDVSTGTPRLLQRVSENFFDGSDLKVSRNGQMVCFVGGGYTNQAGTNIRSGVDVRQVLGTFAAVAPTSIAFSADNTMAYQSRVATPDIDVYDTKTGNLLRTLHPTDDGPVTDLLVDSSDRYLFVAGNSLRAFPLKPIAVATPAKSLLNVSTRLSTQTGDNVLIGGFIITGSETKKIIVRATGPSLPVTGSLADPILELHNPDGSIVTNDNWNEHRADVIASGYSPANEHEAAIVATLQPGVYTAILRGLGDTSGVSLVEVYDLTPNSNSKITNISTRGKVEINDNVMIAGFIIGGDQPTKVIVRALGPSLAASKVSGILNDTTLELHDSNGAVIAFNDDWQSDQEQEINDTNLPPPDPHEAALVRTLPPGLYTAIVHGKNNSTGVALVEVYNLESN